MTDGTTHHIDMTRPGHVLFSSVGIKQALRRGPPGSSAPRLVLADPGNSPRVGTLSL